MNPKKSETGNLIQFFFFLRKISGIFSERTQCLQISKFTFHLQQSISSKPYTFLLSGRNSWASAVVVFDHQSLYEQMPLLFFQREKVFLHSSNSFINKLISMNTNFLAVSYSLGKTWHLCTRKESKMIVFPTCFPRPFVLHLSSCVFDREVQ